MSRPCSALLLLLGLASAGVAQAPNPAPWTFALGDFTIYGHTTYNPTVILVPRRRVRHGPRAWTARAWWTACGPRRRSPSASRPASAPGPPKSYCAGPMSAAMQQVDPRALLGRIQLAARCGVRLVLVPPRRLLTANGTPRGVFSVDSAKRFTDRYAAVLPADTLRKYRATILGLNLADDYGCRGCWGGEGDHPGRRSPSGRRTRARSCRASRSACG